MGALPDVEFPDVIKPNRSRQEKLWQTVAKESQKKRFTKEKIAAPYGIGSMASRAAHVHEPLHPDA
ncbi:hypothetical protein ACFRQM_15085 [Streptomyces sp. NPDC056831]|uniref:hypothetical protein n=1 Tax=Streptomyces sp. NPDC056831 TaxID=3345954 RepID=UPI00368985B5